MKNFQNKAKIIKVSKILQAIAFAGLILWGISIIASVVTGILTPLLVPNLGFSTAHLLEIPLFVFVFITNLKVLRFLDRLKSGCFFDSQTVGYLNTAANWWLLVWLYEVMQYVLMQQPWNNLHDFSLHHFPPDAGGLFAALTLKFVAWFFREAQELQEEQDLTA